MTSESIFSKFASIFAGGGIIQIARKLITGLSGKSLFLSLGERFNRVSPAEFLQMQDLAQNAIDGGETWRNLDPLAIPDPSILPENPALFGDDWFGKRALAVAHVVNEDSGDERDIWLELPDVVPFGEIEDLIQFQLSLFAASYPEKFKAMDPTTQRSIAIQEVIAMKRY